MIIVKISGGLGNQLFQYSFGRSLSIKLNTDLKFDIQTNYNYSFFTKRSFGLGHFNIDMNLATKKEIHEFKCFDNEFLVRLERKIIQKLPFLNRKYVIQNLYNSKKFIPKYRDNCYYDGYWQSENYFKSIEDIIRKDLEFNLQLSQYSKSLLDEINSNESISIHIRRGDYVKVKANSKLFSECSIEYYKKAINFFSAKVKHPQFFIFSDDIEWAKNNFAGSQFSFVDSNIDSPEMDLYLMSRCKNNIIANSSFSWWGGWLNSNPLKIVIVPKKWFNGYLNEVVSDLVPEKWIRI